MKTYLLSILDKFKHFDEKLDATALICSRPWEIFNGGGDKLKLFFKQDKTLIYSDNGVVTYGTWDYEPVSHSVIYSISGTSLLLLPYYYDNEIFALQQDGLNKYLILIDGQNIASYKQLENISDRISNRISGLLKDEKKREKEEQRIANKKQKQEAEKIWQSQKGEILSLNHKYREFQMLWIIPALLAIVFIGILVWGAAANATSDVACIIGIIVFFQELYLVYLCLLYVLTSKKLYIKSSLIHIYEADSTANKD